MFPFPSVLIASCISEGSWHCLEFINPREGCSVADSSQFCSCECRNCPQQGVSLGNFALQTLDKQEGELTLPHCPLPQLPGNKQGAFLGIATSLIPWHLPEGSHRVSPVPSLQLHVLRAFDNKSLGRQQPSTPIRKERVKPFLSQSVVSLLLVLLKNHSKSLLL